MSEKLISAEDFFSEIEKEIKDAMFITDPYAKIKNDYDIGYNNALAMAKAIVMKAPAVDAVEVVLCRDCNHMVRINEACYCNVWGGFNGHGIDGFCCYGERRDKNETN